MLSVRKRNVSECLYSLYGWFNLVNAHTKLSNVCTQNGAQQRHAAIISKKRLDKVSNGHAAAAGNVRSPSFSEIDSSESIA